MVFIFGRMSAEASAGAAARRPRGQAAIEYLMSYGWMILVLLAVVAAFFYLGVFTPQQPKSCTFPTGFTCYEYDLAPNGTLTLDLGQALGKPITVYGVGCSTSATPAYTMLASPAIVRSGGHLLVTNVTPITCTGGVTPSFKGKIFINYTLQGSNLVPRTVAGDLSSPI